LFLRSRGWLYQDELSGCKTRENRKKQKVVKGCLIEVGSVTIFFLK
jgi:hypothetical protein